MAIFSNLTDIARLAINRMVAVTEKEKKLIHKALDSEAEAGFDYTDATMAAHEGAADPHPQYMEDVIDDTTPQLGGTLDFNSNIATDFESTGIDDQSTETMITITDNDFEIGDTGPGVSIHRQADTGYLRIAGGEGALDGACLDLYGDNGVPGYGAAMMYGPIHFQERAAGGVNLNGWGQVWVKNTTPNELWFTDDAGTSVQLGVAGASAPLTTKGDVYTYDTGNQRLAVGTDGYVLTADSSEATGLVWAAASGGVSDIVDDTTPQLGGHLDVNGKAIVSVSAGDITITPDTTGDVVLDGLNWPQADGTSGQVIQTNGAGQLSFASIAAGSSPSTGYGSISVESNATTTTFGGSSTDWTNKVQVTVFDTDGISSSGLTPDHTNDHITVSNAGSYLIHASMSFSGANSETYSFAFFKNNGATQIGNRTTRKLGTGGDVGACDLSTLADLSASDTIELWVQNEGSTGACTLQDVNFEVVGVTGLGNVVEDTTPQLGGDLDVNGSGIVSASAGDISITPDTTGDLILDGLKWPQADGTADYVLKTDGAGQLSWTSGGGGGGGTTFVALTDTPSSYSGQADKWLKVNAGATAVEFVTSPVTSISTTLPLTKSGTTSVTLDINNASGSAAGAMSSSNYTKLAGIESNADKTDAANVAAAGAAMDGGAHHDGFSDYVANEHIDWTSDQGATNIHSGNYTDTDTTYTADDGIVLSGTAFGLNYTASTSAAFGVPDDGELWFQYDP